jgi:hypothetical protein
MININDEFSIKRDQYGWTLYHTYPTDNKKSETGFTTSKSYYPNLHHVINEIFDRAAIGCNCLGELHHKIEQIKSDVYRMIMGGNKN